MSPYSNYRGKSIGRILHYLYKYCGLNVAETALIGDGKVTYHGELFATYEWSHTYGGPDYPHFTFTDNQYNEAQHEKYAIVSLVDFIEEYKDLVKRTTKHIERVINILSKEEPQEIDKLWNKTLAVSINKEFLNELKK